MGRNEKTVKLCYVLYSNVHCPFPFRDNLSIQVGSAPTQCRVPHFKRICLCPMLHTVKKRKMAFCKHRYAPTCNSLRLPELHQSCNDLERILTLAKGRVKILKSGCFGPTAAKCTMCCLYSVFPREQTRWNTV